MSKRKHYGGWHVQTSGYFSLHNEHARGYWLGLEDIRNWEAAWDWVTHLERKNAMYYDTYHLRIALTDIFGPLSGPYSKQAIRARMNSILAAREAA
jgi:hypothetical protein